MLISRLIDGFGVQYQGNMPGRERETAPEKESHIESKSQKIIESEREPRVKKIAAIYL